jgi:carnitine O-acetyltransferase
MLYLFEMLMVIVSVANGSLIPNAVTPNQASPVRLTWKLNAELEQNLSDAYNFFRSEVLGNETCALTFTEFGGQFIKDSNFSPDAFVQMAIQLAYFKLLGRSDA